MSIAVVAGLVASSALAASAAPPVESERFVYGQAQCEGNGFIADQPLIYTRAGFAVSADGDNDVVVGQTVTVAMGIDNPFPGSFAETRDNVVDLSFGSQSETVTPPTSTVPAGPTTYLPPGADATFTVAAEAAGTVVEARVDRWSFAYFDQSGNCMTDPGAGIVGLYVNTSPVLGDDVASTDPENDVVIDVLANDDATWDSGTIISRYPTDAELATQDDLAVVPEADRAGALAIVTAPAHGTAEFAADGTLTYTPTDDFVGADELTYSVTDNDGAVSTATVTIDRVVAAVAEIILTPSAATVDLGESVTFSATGESAGGAALGDVTADIVLTSDVATDVIDGTTVTFSTAGPRTITATYTPTGVTDSALIDVLPAPVVSTPSVTPPGMAAPISTSRGVLPSVGGPTTAWLLAAVATLAGGLAILARRRRTA